jgi:hypothetical protein
MASPAAAAAQQRNTPPGNSSVDQYSESIPGATGEHWIPPGGFLPGHGGHASRSALARRLETQGPAGRLAARTGPPRPAAGAASGGFGIRSPLSEALRVLSGQDGDGLGLLLPILMAASALAVVLLFTRRRRAEPSP